MDWRRALFGPEVDPSAVNTARKITRVGVTEGIFVVH
jgi:hypothetical protein